MNLSKAKIGEEYLIDRIESLDEELDAFLFSLGCYAGEPITVISRRRATMTIAIKDGRYCIDRRLADVIFLK